MLYFFAFFTILSHKNPCIIENGQYLLMRNKEIYY
jgi:hypothetical protein